jgi:hypothetical protein
VGLALVLAWAIGGRRFAEVGQTMGKATGLDRMGKPSMFDPAHTAGNYLLREMILRRRPQACRPAAGSR